jgi:hypothetical protein
MSLYYYRPHSRLLLLLLVLAICLFAGPCQLLVTAASKTKTLVGAQSAAEAACAYSTSAIH